MADIGPWDQQRRRSAPRVAIIHYWLVGMRGGERVLERLLTLFPQADLFTHVYDPEAVSNLIRGREPRTTFIQRLPAARRLYRHYLPLMPLALEELDLRGYDLVISSESGPAKGVIAPTDALHICYCHSPMRYLWDHYPRYRENAGKIARMAMMPTFHKLRLWDCVSARRVDHFIANSQFIRSRIRRAWDRDASVVHPPVATHLFNPSNQVGDEYLWVGEMVSYKRPDLAVKAFNRLRRPLLMVGDGPMLRDVRRQAGPHIRFASHLDFASLRRAYAECRALVFTAEEDFGMVPVEANASGRPVIAYGRGGLTETILHGETGMFFAEQNMDALVEAVHAFELWQPSFRPADAVRNAARFSPAVFDRKLLQVITTQRPDLLTASAQPSVATEFA